MTSSLDIHETDHGFTFTPCDWCKKNKAVAVYRTWILLCDECYKNQMDEDIYEKTSSKEEKERQ